MNNFAEITQEIPRNLKEMWEPSSRFEFLFYSIPRNPNGKGLPQWPKYDQKEGYLQIGTTTQVAHRLKEKEMVFWTELWAKEAVVKPPHKEHVEL